MIPEPLPREYSWLAKEGAPKVIVEALALHGTREGEGSLDNPQILAWAIEAGLSNYTHDETAWCGLFAAIVTRRAGYEPVHAPLWARNWSQWGRLATTPMLGDVLVFVRGNGGHVGFCVGEDMTAFHVLGGNQGDRVSIARVGRSRLVAVRRSPWRIAQPPNVRQIILHPVGTLSTDEA